MVYFIVYANMGCITIKEECQLGKVDSTFGAKYYRVDRFLRQLVCKIAQDTAIPYAEFYIIMVGPAENFV